MDESVSPVETVIQWIISKGRKEEGGFIGFDGYNEKHKKTATSQKRSGFIFKGKWPVVRDGTWNLWCWE